MSSPKGSASKRLLTPSNIITGLLALLVVSMLLFPDVKAVMIRGLMKVGLFQPDIPGPSDAGRTPTGPGVGTTTFRDAQGRSFSLTSLQGKVVLLNFWATWCPPCRAEMPSLDGLYQKLKSDTGFVFLAVDIDGTADRSGSYLKQKGYTIPLAVPGGHLPEALFSGTLPTTVILDRAGNIAMRETGVTDFGSRKLEEFLLRLQADETFNKRISTK